MQNHKLQALEKLATISANAKQQGQTVVLCHGTFDLLHAGHIKHLQQAKALGDILIVTVTADAFVDKGPGRPVFSEQIRAETLAAIEVVDWVGVNEERTSENLIPLIQPSLYVKGEEYSDEAADITGNITKERQLVESYGGKVFYTRGETFSSSHLLNNFFDVFTEDTQRFLQSFKQRYQINEILDKVTALKNLKVAVLGEAIIDEYHYTKPMGQIGKGTALGVQYQESEQFAGGAIAVANHVAGFVEEVALISVLGRKSSDEAFIRSKLAENITPVFSYIEDGPTIKKSRYVTETEKLFEVYYYNEQPDLTQVNPKINAWMDAQLNQYDLIIVTDFGNGSISNEVIQNLSHQTIFMAVNTQLNSGNRGYHAITKYPRADFISLNEPEIRLAAHNRHEALEKVALKIKQQVKATYLSVTRGDKGVLNFEQTSEQPIEVPALANKVVDRVGAGDAYLALTAILLAQNNSLEVASFVGSIAAALNVQVMCNREPINPVLLKKTLTTFLK